MKKPLPGCILCRDCKNRRLPNHNGILHSLDMLIIGYSSCGIDGEDRLTNADRKCPFYKEVSCVE